jgi:tRNA A-37 threonylcarbamoyl transferase component Bud32
MSDDYTLARDTPIGERFLIETPVGAGAQGEVYRAQDRNVRGHRVAIKIMRHPARTEDQRAAAMRELELLSAVHHPSVLHFLDYGWHDGRLWFAMPWLEGETLEEVLLTRQEAKPVFEKLAAGLSALHAVGIRHQDLKPANVFLSKVTGYDELQPQLLDLGVAVRSGELMAAGSLAYFAPEVAGSWPHAQPGRRRQGGRLRAGAHPARGAGAGHHARAAPSPTRTSRRSCAGAPRSRSRRSRTARSATCASTSRAG